MAWVSVMGRHGRILEVENRNGPDSRRCFVRPRIPMRAVLSRGEESVNKEGVVRGQRVERVASMDSESTRGATR